MDEIIPHCPSCEKEVEFTEEDLENYDGHHLEIECPHCHRFCCFVCEHIYGDFFYEKKKTDEQNSALDK